MESIQSSRLGINPATFGSTTSRALAKKGIKISNNRNRMNLDICKTPSDRTNKVTCNVTQSWQQLELKYPNLKMESGHICF